MSVAGLALVTGIPAVQFPAEGGLVWDGVRILVGLSFVVTLIPSEDFERERAAHPGVEISPQRGTPFAMRRDQLLSPLGVPCNPPPWGTLAAVDLRTGELRWQVPLGTTRDKAPFPIWLVPAWRDLGTPIIGGGLLTAGGLYFIGATTDRYFRAFDSRTGEELWRQRIPFNANAIPMTYRLHRDSRQFVVVAAGGNVLTTIGDALLAFALPR